MICEPKNCDPLEWARFNEAMARIVSAEMGIDTPELHMEEIAIRVEEFPPELTDLLLVVRRAAGELQDGGERSNRIAIQLLTALARVEAAR